MTITRRATVLVVSLLAALAVGSSDARAHIISCYGGTTATVVCDYKNMIHGQRAAAFATKYRARYPRGRAGQVARAHRWLERSRQLLIRQRANPARNRKLGRYIVLVHRGWSSQQWSCLDSLWGRYESGWDHRADNPTSDAYGIPQALPGSKMGPGWRVGPVVQIWWGLGYVVKRFGSACSALSFRLTYGWY